MLRLWCKVNPPPPRGTYFNWAYSLDLVEQSLGYREKERLWSDIHTIVFDFDGVFTAIRSGLIKTALKQFS